MECVWVKSTPSLVKGVEIINQIEEAKFEQFARRIIAKMKLNDTDIFTNEEKQKLVKIFKIDEETLLLAIKTLLYLFKRLLKYIFMPVELKNDLKCLGFQSEKAETIAKLWSAETRITLNGLISDTSDSDENIEFNWKLNAELTSEYHKKSRIAKAYLSLSGGTNDVEMELTHPELYSMYLQFETIQNELDNLLVQ